MKFKVGDIVCSNDQGRLYYHYDQDRIFTRARVVSVLDTNPQLLQVAHDGGLVVSLYGNCVDFLDGVTDDEVNAAIESITKTPRRGQ